MLRWSLGLTLFDHTLNTDVCKRFGVAPIGSKMQEARLRWYTSKDGMTTQSPKMPSKSTCPTRDLGNQGSGGLTKSMKI